MHVRLSQRRKGILVRCCRKRSIIIFLFYFYIYRYGKCDDCRLIRDEKSGKKNNKNKRQRPLYNAAAGRTTMGMNLLSPSLLSATISPPLWIFDRFLQTKRESSRYIKLACVYIYYTRCSPTMHNYIISLN